MKNHKCRWALIIGHIGIMIAQECAKIKSFYKKSWISCGFYRFSLFRNNILCIDFFIYLYAVTEK